MIKDPNILLSVVNTKLRDKYNSLDEFCDMEDITKTELYSILNSINYYYDETLNQFIIK